MSIHEKYQIIQELGGQTKRKFGRTFLVQNKVTHEKCVMKTVIKNENSKFIEEQLSSESNFSFDGQFLPSTIDFLENENEVILIRSFFEGSPVDEYWNAIKKKKNQLQFLSKFLIKFSEVYKKLEDENIVHCDIKPSNIIIQESDGDFSVHLIDFGIALNNNKQNKRKLIFPLGYAAPELILNKLDLVSNKADQYSLAVVIWRLLDGHLPLAHPNPSIFTNLQLNLPLPESSSIKNRVMKVLRKASSKHSFRLPPDKMDQKEVKGLLTQSIDSRYGSMNVFCNTLQTELDQPSKFTIKYLFGNRN